MASASTSPTRSPGRGVVDYLFRGFGTKISPPPGENLGDSRGGRFIGEMIDLCPPVGAITEKVPPFVKPGPWKTRAVRTVCNGCSLACEMAVEVYDGMLVRASRVDDSWNRHICDHCRFDRPWAGDLSGPLLNGRPVGWEEARRFISERSYALILTPNLTNEEIAFFMEFAGKRGIPIGSTVRGGLSTATLEDIKRAGRVLLRADVEKFPLLMILLRGGKEIVEDGYDVAIIEGGEPLGGVPTLILHEGVNSMGAAEGGYKGNPPRERRLRCHRGEPGMELGGAMYWWFPRESGPRRAEP